MYSLIKKNHYICNNFHLECKNGKAFFTKGVIEIIFYSKILAKF